MGVGVRVPVGAAVGVDVGVRERAGVGGRRTAGWRLGSCWCVSAKGVVVGACVCVYAGVAAGTGVGASRRGSWLGRVGRGRVCGREVLIFEFLVFSFYPRVGNFTEWVQVLRCALWMIRAVFAISDLGPRRLSVRSMSVSSLL